MGLMPYMAVFAKVVELGSFSAAALQLGLTASAVSRQVATLEKALAVKLLERTTRSLRLSEAGAEVYARCCEMVEAGRSVMAVADRFVASPQGLVRLSAPKAFGRKLISPHIAEFLGLYPEVDVQLMLIDRPMDLIGDGLDLMIRITDTPPPGLAARPLLDVYHLLCASPAYLERAGHPAHPHDLARHSCIYLGETPGDNRWHLRHGASGEQVSVSVRGRFVSNHSEARLDAVLDDLGIGCLPFFTAAQALKAERVVEVLPQWRYETSYFGKAWMLYPPNRYLPPKCRVLIDFLAARVAAH
ncbi:MAG: LysR family transcriptional regulator [Pseudomonas sp.]|nr:LysR family transcriptional regulator [Pseudomonas sp. PIA16]MDE1164607.1 LysR family transcriptional regulator [Pseudomonas sp.]